MKLSIIMPIYNERATLPEILRRINESDTLGLEKEIVLVDDGSTDGTRDILKTLEDKYKIFYHQKNTGKGAALRNGFEKATGDIILIQDADLEYSPKNYPDLLRPILRGEAEIVYGSRNLKKNYGRNWRYYLGGKITNFLFNIINGSSITDFWTCYKVFKADVLKSFELKSNDFYFEAEVTMQALKKKYKILEVPIDYFPRDPKDGKKIKPKDGLIAIWKILKYKFSG